METADMMVDGNAVAGALGEVFMPEMTTARIVCESCGSIQPIGAEHGFVHAPGIVLRCRECDGVVLVMTRAPGRYIIGFHGTVEILS
jgi:DNA-directed RNA polymerase subunit RPC12/RpoP